MDVLGKGFTKPTARIQALRDAIYDATPTVEADRAELVTASYKETEGLPVILRTASTWPRMISLGMKPLSPRKILAWTSATMNSLPVP